MILSFQRRFWVASWLSSRFYTPTVKDLVHEMTRSSQEKPPAAWSLLLSPKTRTFHQPSSASSISPNQKETVEMKDEVLSSVDAQELDTSGYLVSDLEDIEFHWGELGLNMDAVCWPGIDTPFSPSTLNDFEMNLMAENPTLFDEEEDKENCPSLPTTPVSERPSEHPVLMNNRPFGT